MRTIATDQVIKTVRQHLNDSMRWVKNQVCQHPQYQAGRDACNRCWTRATKAALCKACQAAWGECNPMQIFATQDKLTKPRAGTVCHQPPNHVHITAAQVGPHGWNADHGEWLYDVTCLKYENPWPTQQKVLLVAEVEWGGGDSHAAVLDDFAKILVVRAEMRVMVYHKAHVPIKELAGYIHQCGDTQPGDTYILAAFGDPPDTPRIVYYQIDAQGGRKLLPIPGDWYPGYGPP